MDNGQWAMGNGLMDNGQWTKFPFPNFLLLTSMTSITVLNWLTACVFSNLATFLIPILEWNTPTTSTGTGSMRADETDLRVMVGG